MVQGVERGVREAGDLGGAEGRFGARPRGARCGGVDSLDAVGERDARVYRRLHAGVLEDVVEDGGGRSAHVIRQMWDRR